MLYDLISYFNVIFLDKLSHIRLTKGILCYSIPFLILWKWREMITCVILKNIIIMNSHHTSGCSISYQIQIYKDTILVKLVIRISQPCYKACNTSPYRKCSCETPLNTLLKISLSDFLKSIWNQIKEIIILTQRNLIMNLV